MGGCVARFERRQRHQKRPNSRKEPPDEAGEAEAVELGAAAAIAVEAPPEGDVGERLALETAEDAEDRPEVSGCPEDDESTRQKLQQQQQQQHPYQLQQQPYGTPLCRPRHAVSRTSTPTHAQQHCSRLLSHSNGASRTGSPQHHLHHPGGAPPVLAMASRTPEPRRTSLPPQRLGQAALSLDDVGKAAIAAAAAAAVAAAAAASAGASPCRRSNGTPVPLINSSRASSLKQFQLLQQQQQQQQQQLQHAAGSGLVAMFNYVARTEGELSFSTGDVMQLIEQTDSNWWYVEHRTTKARGYVPVALVAVQNSLDAKCWFLGPLPRKEAERQLLMPGNESGTFLVRESETHRESYSLSVLDFDQAKGRNTVKHYRIRQTDAGAAFCITSRQKFPSVQALIENYSARQDGLCCVLTRPCQRPVPTIADLSYQTRDKWEIPRDQIQLVERLGSGQFGEVWRGLFNGRLEVAVKMLRGGGMSRAEFLKEARIMKRLRHPKLVQLFAVCTQEDPVYIVTELMSHGALLAHLRDSEARLDLGALVDIMGQIASGMAYLEAERFIHRDLAARNILVGDNNSVKVADFGLSRAIGDAESGEYTAKQGAKFPIKWTSPEAAMFGRFSIKSDVWSFGIVLFEIVTRGQVPYASMSNTETLTAVDNGYRMPRPAECPEPLYQLMLSCWDPQPELRPTFTFLKAYFDDFFPASEPSYRPASGEEAVAVSQSPSCLV